MLSKTAFNRMKKAELVEWALEAQRTAGRAALFAEEEQEELENLKKDLFQDRGELESLKKEIEAVKENKQLKEEIECLEVALAIVKDKHAVDKKNVHKLMDELKQLKEEVRETWVCDEESAINYVYENGDAYDDWVKGSTPYEELLDEKKELKKRCDYAGEFTWSDRKQELIDVFMEESGSWSCYREWLREYHEEDYADCNED